MPKSYKLCVPITKQRRDKLNDLAFLRSTSLAKLVNEVLEREIRTSSEELSSLRKVRKNVTRYKIVSKTEEEVDE